jgi:DNA-binding NtrC family response regulator
MRAQADARSQALLRASSRAARPRGGSHRSNAGVRRLTDVVMPQMGGPALAMRLAQVRPEMKVLYMSGYTDDTAIRHGLIDREVAYLQKPITIETLTKRVRDVLDAKPRLTEMALPAVHDP